MNPFQRLGVKISNWWRGEPQDSGGVTDCDRTVREKGCCGNGDSNPREQN